jgi:hypothetical protein
MPALVGVDFGMQGLEFQHALAIEIEFGAPLVLLEEFLDLDQPGSHDIADVLLHRLGQGLGELADDEVALVDDLASVRFEFTGDQAKGRGFARAVPPDQADAFTRIDRKRCVGQDLLVAELEGDLVKSKQGHSG